MKAQYVYEAIDFERGKDPKEALNLGIKWKFGGELPNPFWTFLKTIRDNLHLFTDGKYHKDDIIPYVFPSDGEYGLPNDLVKDVQEKYLNNTKLHVAYQKGNRPPDYMTFQDLRKSLYHEEKNGKKIRSKENAFIWESLEFERGRDPKAAMGIGLTADELVDDVIKSLPEILKTDDIPRDILYSPTYVMKKSYLNKVDRYLAKLFGFYCDRDGNFWKNRESFVAGDKFSDFDSMVGFPGTDGFYQKIHHKLKSMGYSTS